MKLEAFRITNFRSIVDTGWCNFSPDGITVLVGQNESGKTSILEALSKTFSPTILVEDDCRSQDDLPVVDMRVRVTEEEIARFSEERSSSEVAAIRAYFENTDYIVDMSFYWERNEEGTDPTFRGNMAIRDETLEHLLALASPATIEKTVEIDGEQKKVTENDTPFTSDDLAVEVYSAAPEAILFDEKNGLLPDKIDVIKNKDGRFILRGDGAQAAKNFLKIANISIDKLIEGNVRSREIMLGRANSIISSMFGEFWTQTIAKRDKIQLECAIRNYGPDEPEKIGQPHLVFWIKDGHNRLYPRQRSQGVRWFVSFFLQLTASKSEKDSALFLLDEPGANLHGKAQADVLKLLNTLRQNLTIMYSTHTPGLVEYEKLFRVMAVQRDGELDDSPTVVIDAHRLSSASRDTLSALSGAMGTDLSQQVVIKKKDNVLLEEISAFYYLTAFWRLTNCKQSAHFIAANGTGNMEPLANMFLGWGLDFIAVMDDEGSGRGVYNRIKKNLCGDDDENARELMYKIKDCAGIEDTFSNSDFIKFVLEGENVIFEVPNSQFVKDEQRAKAVLGYRFLIAAERGDFKLKDFDAETRKRIELIVSEIEKRLKNRR